MLALRHKLPRHLEQPDARSTMCRAPADFDWSAKNSQQLVVGDVLNNECLLLVFSTCTVHHLLLFFFVVILLCKTFGEQVTQINQN